MTESKTICSNNFEEEKYVSRVLWNKDENCQITEESFVSKVATARDASPETTEIFIINSEAGNGNSWFLESSYREILKQNLFSLITLKNNDEIANTPPGIIEALFPDIKNNIIRKWYCRFKLLSFGKKLLISFSYIMLMLMTSILYVYYEEVKNIDLRRVISTQTIFIQHLKDFYQNKTLLFLLRFIFYSSIIPFLSLLIGSLYQLILNKQIGRGGKLDEDELRIFTGDNYKILRSKIAKKCSIYPLLIVVDACEKLDPFTENFIVHLIYDFNFEIEGGIKIVLTDNGSSELVSYIKYFREERKNISIHEYDLQLPDDETLLQIAGTHDIDETIYYRRHTNLVGHLVAEKYNIFYEKEYVSKWKELVSLSMPSSFELADLMKYLSMSGSVRATERFRLKDVSKIFSSDLFKNHCKLRGWEKLSEKRLKAMLNKIRNYSICKEIIPGYKERNYTAALNFRPLIVKQANLDHDKGYMHHFWAQYYLHLFDKGTIMEKMVLGKIAVYHLSNADLEYPYYSGSLLDKDRGRELQLIFREYFSALLKLGSLFIKCADFNNAKMAYKTFFAHYSARLQMVSASPEFNTLFVKGVTDFWALFFQKGDAELIEIYESDIANNIKKLGLGKQDEIIILNNYYKLIKGVKLNANILVELSRIKRNNNVQDKQLLHLAKFLEIAAFVRLTSGFLSDFATSDDFNVNAIPKDDDYVALPIYEFGSLHLIRSEIFLLSNRKKRFYNEMKLYFRKCKEIEKCLDDFDLIGSAQNYYLTARGLVLILDFISQHSRSVERLGNDNNRLRYHHNIPIKAERKYVELLQEIIPGLDLAECVFIPQKVFEYIEDKFTSSKIIFDILQMNFGLMEVCFHFGYYLYTYKNYNIENWWQEWEEEFHKCFSIERKLKISIHIPNIHKSRYDFFAERDIPFAKRNILSLYHSLKNNHYPIKQIISFNRECSRIMTTYSTGEEDYNHLIDLDSEWLECFMNLPEAEQYYYYEFKELEEVQALIMLSQHHRLLENYIQADTYLYKAEGIMKQHLMLPDEDIEWNLFLDLQMQKRWLSLAKDIESTEDINGLYQNTKLRSYCNFIYVLRSKIEANKRNISYQIMVEFLNIYQDLYAECVPSIPKVYAEVGMLLAATYLSKRDKIDPQELLKETVLNILMNIEEVFETTKVIQTLLETYDLIMDMDDKFVDSYLKKRDKYLAIFLEDYAHEVLIQLYSKASYYQILHDYRKYFKRHYEEFSQVDNSMLESMRQLLNEKEFTKCLDMAEKEYKMLGKACAPSDHGICFDNIILLEIMNSCYGALNDKEAQLKIQKTLNVVSKEMLPDFFEIIEISPNIEFELKEIVQKLKYIQYSDDKRLVSV